MEIFLIFIDDEFRDENVLSPMFFASTKSEFSILGIKYLKLILVGRDFM